MATDESTESGVDWLSKRYFDELSVQLRTVWDIYIKFYTVFLTFNILALAAVIQYVDRPNRSVIVVAFVLQNILSAVTAVYIGRWSNATAQQQMDVASAIARADQTSDQPAELPSHLQRSPPRDNSVCGVVSRTP